jgi:hypothetical protein
LPVGIQDFEKLRANDFLYVDKTAYAYQLATSGKPYFLGRPRRFGKSLFLSTLKAYFEGKRELFEGLAIVDMEKDWTKYPVIYLDFNTTSCDSVDSLNRVLDNHLGICEAAWGLERLADLSSLRFYRLIQKVAEKTGQKVVVLIDEYDKPLINTIDDDALNDGLRQVLKGFYGALKSADADLRFVFLTGVTKFSKVSIFSDLNQLVDISMDNKYAEICGISETELVHYFKPEIDALAKATGQTRNEALAEIKKRYDGYHFAKVSADMYNPFSVLNTFDKLDFGSYWYETGTPTMLAKQVKNERLDLRDFDEDIAISESEIKDFRPGETSVIPLLFQSGYLTIKSYDPGYNVYNLGFPNEEVKYGFLKNLLPTYAPARVSTINSFFAGKFVRDLRENNVEGFMTQLTAFYASIPYDAVKKEDKTEQHYQFVFYLLFKLMGQFVDIEVKSGKGRADAVVKTGNAIYVFEFKMDANATAEEALAQINDKGYLIPYAADTRQLVKIGVEFSVEQNGIKRWLME